MELVYLWVEGYKNIQKQEFNFSPRFNCKFDEDTEKLIVDEKKDYMNIFPANINVTAIVGENGSGKSSILKLLAEIFRIEYNKNRNLIVDDEHHLNFFLAFKIKNKIYEVKSINGIDDNSFKSGKKIENILDYYNYFNDESNIENQILLDNFSIAKMIVHSHYENQEFKLSSFMYMPTTLIIKVCDFNKKFEELISNNKLYPMSNNESDSTYLKNMSNEIIKQCEYFDSLNDKYHQFLIIKLLEKIESRIDYPLSKEDIVKKLNDKNLIIEEAFNKYFDFSGNSFGEKKENINKLKKKEKKIYLDKYRNFFEFDFSDNKKRKYSDLSHGEKMLFGHLLNIYYNSKISKNDNLLFLFDEPEISLHPNWQKNYIKELDSLLKRIGKEYHFILSSHSPFILSDLSKENVIFLEKDRKTGECINATNKVDINPFGANIHTLLSHGFFMKDGLMGEFAKDKINDVIKILNSKRKVSKKNQKYYKHLISIIGEPFLKEKLSKMYDEKFKISKEERIKQLKKELAELEK
ncbi:MAG: AAA family ATPase [Arcobacter sp.]|uniref:AAA family ATPase n=1 Tax=Arcobacter sp. TaxID=1872629 RepID=UPI003AFF8A98